MIGLLALGAIGFWFLLFIVGIIVTVLVENEHSIFSAWLLTATVLILEYSYHLHIFSAFAMHPLQMFMYGSIYILTGMLWGIAKWYFFVLKRLDKYNRYKANFLRENNATELTPQLAVVLTGQLEHHYMHEVSPTPPEAGDFRSDIIRWMVYWPFSMLGSLLNDFVREMYNIIYAHLVTVYERIATHAFRNATKDVEAARQYTSENPASLTNH